MDKTNAENSIHLSWEDREAQEEVRSSEIGAAWLVALNTDWATADTAQVAAGAEAWWRARAYSVESVLDEVGEDVLSAIVARALNLGAKLGEMRSDYGSFASNLVHASPDAYQEAMEHPNFDWRDTATWSSVDAQAWAKAPGEEGLERLVGLMVSQGGDSRQDWSQAPWDLAWMMSARPQDKASASLGAAIGLEALHGSTQKATPDQTRERLAFANSVLRILGADDLASGLGQLVADNDGKILKVQKAKEVADDKAWKKSRSLEAWSVSFSAAFEADEPDLFSSLLASLEKKWPGMGRLPKNGSLNENCALFSEAVEARAPKCAAFALDSGLGTGLALAKSRGAEPRAAMFRLAELAQSDAARKPSEREGWEALFETAERAGLSECMAAGMPSKDAVSAIELASFGDPRQAGKLSEREANQEAARISQATRLARIVADIESGAKTDHPSKAPSQRL